MTFKRPSLGAILTLTLITGIICTFAGCGDDGVSPTPPNPQADVNEYLAELPEWDEFASVQDTSTAPIGEVLADMSQNVLRTTTPYSITQNPEAVVTFGAAPDVMYLGSLIQGDTYLGGLGSMEELPIRQRAPLTIALKLFTGTEISREVANPNAATVQAALNDLVSEASSGQEPGSRTFYEYKQAYSSQQAALSVGMSFKYMGSYGRAALDFESSEEKTTVTAYLKQIMFEAYIVRPQTPAQFFSDEFTMELLDEQVQQGNIGPENLPVYVSRIQYGRMLIYSMTSTASREMMAAAAEYGYSGTVSADIKAQVENIVQNATIKVASIGGDDDGIRAMIRSGNLSDYFAENAPLTTAEPLAYALYNLADGSLAAVSETTEYDVREYAKEAAMCFTNRTEWELAIEGLAGSGHLTKFMTTPENLLLANEVHALPIPNTGMGSILTFGRSVTTYPFDFTLKATIGGYSLVYDDQESGPGFAPLDQARSISIGDINNNENDNFEIAIPEWNTNAAVFAIGITVGHNEAKGEEFIDVHCIGEFDHRFQDRPSCPSSHGFMGVVATVPIKSMFFNEDNGGDDIFVRDFEFAHLEW
jgi:hypothetical protein